MLNNYYFCELYIRDFGPPQNGRTYLSKNYLKKVLGQICPSPK